MSSTIILDHYRLPIINDKNLFHVLSAIYKLGPIHENKINHKINIDIDENKLKFIITKLYRSNLIKENRNNEWRVSSLSENILTSIGISEIITYSLIEEINNNNDENLFLKSCIYNSKDRNFTWSKNINNILKASKFAFDFISSSKDISDNDKSDVLFALIIGTNPGAKNIDIDTYCHKVANIYLEDHPNYFDILFTKKNKLKEQISLSCEKAEFHFKSSNKFFISDELEINNVVSLVSFIRIIANIYTRDDISELKIVNLFDKKQFDKKISYLINSHLENIDINLIKNLCIFLGIDDSIREFENIKDVISHLVKTIITNSNNNPIPIGFSKENNMQLDNNLIEPIGYLKEKITSGSLDFLAHEDKCKIVNLLKSTTKAAEDKFLH